MMKTHIYHPLKLAKDTLRREFDLVVAKVTCIPHPHCPTTSDLYCSRANKLQLVKKYLHKSLRLRLNNQSKLEIKKISRNQKVLWVYTGKRNFGDAIMELSGRSLLKDKGFSIDLFTLPHLVELFKHDQVFNNVYSDIETLKHHHYDVVLMQEFNYPSIKLKTRYLRKLPYACLFGFFYGPDRNQSYFSFYAVNDIFGLEYDTAHIEKHAKSILFSDRHTQENVKKIIPDEPYISISVGGIDPLRTYKHWHDVLLLIDSLQSIKYVCLIGSDNGLEFANLITKNEYKNLEIVTFVGNKSLIESFEIIKNSTLFMGCDGGLVHVASAANTPSVMLFGGDALTALRITKAIPCIAIHSINSVNNIPASQVFECLCSALKNTPTQSKSFPSQCY